jgi:RNA polymerase sigma factor (sigma-70 family)
MIVGGKSTMSASPLTVGSLLLQLHGPPSDEAGWADFVRIYGGPVLRWCRQHGLQEVDAQDVAQEVLAKFWNRAATFEYDPARRFRGYLRRIVVSAVSDWSTRRGSRPLGSGQDSETVLASLPAREDLIARIEAAYDTELVAAAMREVEARVQPHTWSAFRLLAIEGLPGAEVAARLGMEVNTAYVARKKVQRMIREVATRLERSGAESE